MKQYYVLIGNFGSGKSEISINTAVDAAAAGNKTVLIDLDIINPYFRSAERKAELEAAGVKLLHPIFAMSTVDVPSLPPDIYSVFIGDYDTVVFDVGGDPAGATALGQYKPNFETIAADALHIYYVINQRRPRSETAEQVLKMFEIIKYRSRLSITGFINNSNLAVESSAEDLIAGYELLREVSDKTGIPVAFTTGVKPALDGFLAYADAQGLDRRYIGEPREINIYMHRDWDRFTTLGV